MVMIVMKLIYDDKSIDVTKCKSFFSRFKGFMLCKEIENAKIFDNCNSIHTFFMKRNIDVIMCDKNDTILYYFNDVNRNKIIWPKKGVFRTIELPVNFFDVKINTKIKVIE